VKAKVRTTLLIAALVATLGAVYWASTLDKDQAVEPVVRTATPGTRPRAQDSARPAAGTGELNLSRLQRSPSLEPSGQLFVPQDFTPAPPPLPKRPIAQPAAVAQPAPPPPPQAPPLPFSYLGKLAEGTETKVFLTQGDRNLVVKPGDVIDNTYRVEEIGEAAVVMTYLPLSVKQTLPIGAK
jgi:hypothetical protein